MPAKDRFQASRHLLIVLVLLSGNAAALDELGPATLNTPLPGPGERNIGWQWHYVDQNGDAGHMEKVASSMINGEEHASYRRSDGCSWTRPVRGFAPAIRWNNCPSDGTSRVSHVSGNIWPLEVGKAVAYRIRGNSSLIGKAFSSTRRCSVVGTMRIRTVLDEFDTYKVQCKERWGTRTWWLSPRVGTAVAYQQTTRRGDLLRQEMTRIVAPP